MAYSEQTATDIDQIPALIAAFATARGWTVSGTTLTRPGGGRSFEVTSVKDATKASQHRLVVTDTADTTRLTWTSLPQVNGADYANPVILTPTKIHLFGNDTPWDEEGAVAPWIACVIECGYNHYRHVYIGNMVKIGNYTGGEIISANYFAQYWVGSPNNIAFGSDYHRYLFSAHNDAGYNSSQSPQGKSSGGVNIVHADNPVPYRYFDGPTGNTAMEDFTGVEVFGGAQDGINAGLVRRGVSDFAGAAILVPVNLFVPDGNNDVDFRIRPIGFAPGVRMVDLRDHQSGESIAVGNRNWRVFGEFQRNPAQYVNRNGYLGAPGYWWQEETSYYLGLAYPETDV